MEQAQMRDAVRVAAAAQRMGVFGAQDWSNLATLLLVDGFDSAEVVELASAYEPVSEWVTEPLVVRLCQYLEIEPTGADAAASLLAQLMADDLRARPASVTAPMIRMLAKVAAPDFDSELANECFGAAEYLDCNCVAQVDPSLEAELEALAALNLPDGLVECLARPIRSTLPTVQPPHDH